MAAGTLNLTIEQGATWTTVLTWKINNSLVNLTGYTARMQARLQHAQPETLLSLTTSTGITLGGALGTITLTVSATATAAMAPGKYVYDLELISAGSEVTRLVEGILTVSPEVTR